MARDKDTTARPTGATSRSRLMKRAWEIFRERTGYPYTSFKSIGRNAFASALKAAWHEAREAVRLAKHGAEALRAMIADLTRPEHAVGYATSYTGRAERLLSRSWQAMIARNALQVAVQMGAGR